MSSSYAWKLLLCAPIVITQTQIITDGIDAYQLQAPSFIRTIPLVFEADDLVQTRIEVGGELGRWRGQSFRYSCELCPLRLMST